MINVVVGILRRNHKILVAERPPHKPYSGYWEFPGGKIEKNESAEMALKRELEEELGILVINAKPWCELIHTYPDKTVSLNLWLVSDFLNEPTGKEQQTLQWVTLSEMKALRLLEGNYNILDKIEKNLIESLS